MTFPGSGAKFTLQLSAKLAFYLVLLPAPAFVLTVPRLSLSVNFLVFLTFSPALLGGLLCLLTSIHTYSLFFDVIFFGSCS